MATWKAHLDKIADTPAAMSALRGRFDAKGGAMLQKITSSPSKLWMGRGSHGVTTQEMTVLWDGAEARVTVKRVNQGEVTLSLDKVELEALATWIGGIVPR